MENMMILNSLPSTEIESVNYFVDARDRALAAITTLKKFIETLDASGIAYMQANGIKEIETGPGKKIYIANEKKEKWLTESVYDLFDFPQHVRDILEANPGFRKRAIEAKTGGKIITRKPGEINTEALIEVEYLDRIKVKEIDDRFLK